MSENGPTPKEGVARSAPFMLAMLAGLVGANGVALAAVAAHRVDSPALATASTMLMIHAAAGLAIAALAPSSPRSGWWRALGILMMAAVALFGGDIAMNTLKGQHIFPMAAPAGGSLLIASWLAAAAVAALDWRDER